MAIPDERLVLEASVVDDFTDTLLELSEGLAEIDRLAASTVENIEAHVDIDEALRELGTLDAAIRAVKDDIQIGTDTDFDVGQRNDLFDLDGIDLSDREAVGVADLFNKHPGSVWSETPSMGTGSSGATADGGGDDDTSGLLDATQLRRARQQFGQSFSPNRLIQEGGAQRLVDVLDGDVTEFIDTDQASRQILDGDLDPDIFKRLSSLDTGDAFDALETLKDEGLTDLPTTITDEFKRLELTMGDFYRILAGLIPLLGIIVGAVPAVVGGLVALGTAALAAAGALAGVAGLALLGASLGPNGEINTDQLAERFNEFIDTAINELGPLARQLAPLVNETFRSMERLLAGIADRGDAVLAVTDEFRGALQFIETNGAAALAALIRFGEAAMPVLGGILREVGNMDILESFANILITMLPYLAVMGAELAAMLGPIYRLSIGFAAFASALIRVTSMSLQFLGALGPLLPLLGGITSVLLSLVTVSALYSFATAGATGAALAFSKALAMSAIGAITKTIGSLYALISAEYGTAVATVTLTAAFSVLLGVITFGIAPALGSLSTGFTDLSGDIDAATDSLRTFTSASGDVGGVNLGMNGAQMQSRNGGYTNAGSMTVVAPDKQTGNAVANTLGFGQSSVNDDVANRIHNQ